MCGGSKVSSCQPVCCRTRTPVLADVWSAARPFLLSSVDPVSSLRGDLGEGFLVVQMQSIEGSPPNHLLAKSFRALLS